MPETRDCFQCCCERSVINQNLCDKKFKCNKLHNFLLRYVLCCTKCNDIVPGYKNSSYISFNKNLVVRSSCTFVLFMRSEISRIRMCEFFDVAHFKFYFWGHSFYLIHKNLWNGLHLALLIKVGSLIKNIIE